MWAVWAAQWVCLGYDRAMGWQGARARRMCGTWQSTHQSCRQLCTTVQQQLFVSVMCRWMRMTTASHQSASLRSSIARSARSRSTMWSAAVAFVAPTHHVARTCGETERETAKRHLRAKRGVLMRAGGLPHACRRPHGYTCRPGKIYELTPGESTTLASTGACVRQSANELHAPAQWMDREIVCYTSPTTLRATCLPYRRLPLPAAPCRRSYTMPQGRIDPAPLASRTANRYVYSRAHWG